MARFSCDGLDDLMQRMQRMGVALDGTVADEMLMAGAEQVKAAWQNSAEKHGHRNTGALIESITYPRQPKTVGDVRSIDIYPQGRDSKGVRNAEKAFIMHYGTSKMPGSHWVDDADRECDSTVIPAMEAVLDKHIKRSD